MRSVRSSTRKIALLCFEKDAKKLESIREHLGADLVYYSKDVWGKVVEYDCIVAYLAAGIVVRGLCGKLKGKWVDPAVIVLDKPLKHAVVLLGGHHGGNEVAMKLEEIGLKAVITTAMEFSEGYSVGVGFRKNVKAEEIYEAIMKGLGEIGATLADVKALATVECKEKSQIVEVAEIVKKPLIFVKKDEINSMDIRQTSAIKIGVKNVAEACAIYASTYGELVLPKKIYGGVTVAIAR